MQAIRSDTNDTLSNRLAIVVVGASGDLARRKIMPALFSLFARKLLPPRFAVFGFARSRMTTRDFHNRLSDTLACRYTPPDNCETTKATFLQNCHYIRGNYDQPDSFLDLYRQMRAVFPDQHPDCLYYLAIPPSVFLDCAHALGDSGMVLCGRSPFWTRVVVEKPFGHDRKSSDRLVEELAAVFNETDTYRIDHYLGKEIVQNLLVLRFANSVFEPLWNRDAIERVEIDWRETQGVENRAAYFDRYGIIRDVVQNHLLQIIALVGMERPAGRRPDQIRDAKVALLKAVRPPTADAVWVGQYGPGPGNGPLQRAYKNTAGVAADSITPTGVRMALKIENQRWNGVPFVVSAAKAMDVDRTEIRLMFRNPVSPWHDEAAGSGKSNQLVIRVQPSEAIRLRVMTKEPGLTSRTVPTDLELLYSAAFEQAVPEAYERLLLDVVQGDKSLFIRQDELAASWDVFTPLLHDLERSGMAPEPYASGSRELPHPHTPFQA